MTEFAGDLVVLVPLYRERQRLPKTLDELRAFCREQGALLMFVDGASDDGTGAWIDELAAQDSGLVAVHAPLGGKGLNQRLGLAKGLQLAPKASFLLTDCDLSTPLRCYADLRAEAGDADIVLGSRVAAGADVSKPQGWFKRTLGRAGNLLIRTLLGLPFRDTQCGFRLLSPQAAALAEQCRCDGAGLDFEMLALAARRGLRLREVGVEWRNDPDSRFGGSAYLRALLELLGVFVRLRLLRR